MATSTMTDWNEDMKLKLALGVLEYKCHLTKNGVNKADKWTSLLSKLKQHPTNIDERGICKIKINKGDALKNTFYRFRDEELKDIDDQSYNLSGRSAVKSQYRMLMETLLDEEEREKDQKKQKQAVKKGKSKADKAMADQMMVTSSQLGSNSLKSTENQVDLSRSSDNDALTENSSSPRLQVATKKSPIINLEDLVSKFLEDDDNEPSDPVFEQKKQLNMDLKNDVLSLKKKKLELELANLQKHSKKKRNQVEAEDSDSDTESE